MTLLDQDNGPESLAPEGSAADRGQESKEIGRQFFCDECKDFTHVSVTGEGGGRIVQRCRECGRPVTFVPAVGGWVPEPMIGTIESFAIGSLANAIEEREGAKNAPGPREAGPGDDAGTDEGRPSLASRLSGLRPRGRRARGAKTQDAMKPIIYVDDEEPAPAPRTEEKARDRIESVRTMRDALALAKGDRRIAERILTASERSRLDRLEEL